MRLKILVCFRASEPWAPRRCEKHSICNNKPSGWKKFISDCCSGVRRASTAVTKRYVAKNFVTEVEEARGSTDDAAWNTKTKLVEAKLEMVRADGLFHFDAAVPRVRGLNTRDRLQRDEIDRSLQGGAGPRQSGSRCD